MRWTMIVLAASLWTLTSCAGHSSAVLPVTVAPRANDSATFNGWLNGLLNAYRDNCITLRVHRKEDHTVCTQP